MLDHIGGIRRVEGPKSVVDQVADRLREAITSGQIPPGSKLPETRLAQQMGVSRIPIREALARLEAEGLIKRIPYRGTVVVELTVDQVVESFMLRALLEGFATKVATPRLSQYDLAKLRKLVIQLGECADPAHHEQLTALHREFHSTIYMNSGYAKLISWIEELYYQFPKNLKRIFRFKEPVEECARIVDALEARDAELAGKLMSDHLLMGNEVAVRNYTNMLSGAGTGEADEVP